ncbi:MAG: isochorismatase family cysteine hydrolase [Nitrospinota bacterium]|jgi:ureidoacrylate peracid hydrolase|nr:isochorismatase family cysteine hydrolase [Nitrospinota bacterium]MDP6484083.1 isochorismatase family cysteine hydrolase [Nitrospinota bacterium]MDP6618733.1 isochorismatase family cysteine hydrolase [Nitrospinota bacterium]HJM43218.1 isochorismatase family cysteine hydrolase [Nitrospinota bacterium]
MTIQLDPERTALLVIDMQNGFCHPEGGLAKAGQDNAPQVAVVPAVKELIRLARGAGIRAAWSKQVHFPGNRAREGRAAASHLQRKPKGGSPICARGSRDVEIVDDLASDVALEDEVIVKHKMSCFYNTRLDEVLRMWGVTGLILCGVSTYVCVESTVRDAYFRDYDIVVVEDCVAGSIERLHLDTLEKVRMYFGEVVTLKALEGVWTAGSAAHAAPPGIGVTQRGGPLHVSP